jgi:hypothetical protein
MRLTQDEEMAALRSILSRMNAVPHPPVKRTIRMRLAQLWRSLFGRKGA